MVRNVEIVVVVDASDGGADSDGGSGGYMDYTKEINGHTLEYFDDEHLYLVDGMIVPSITQILGSKFGRKYERVDRTTLQRASEAGTQVHDAIERLCKTGEIADFPEVRNFIFLQKQYGFKVLENEVPVILFRNDEPISAGRLDMIIEMGGQIGGADIKRTAALDKDYLAYQLNLYRIAYRQCYGIEWEFLRGIHLRNDVRKFVTIPINENITWQLVHEYMEENK
jgi:hypothetical protein